VIQRGFLAAVLVVLSGLPATAAIISLGTRINISPTTFALPIEVSGENSVFGWQFDLTYDPSDVIVNLACDPFSGDVYCSLFTGPVTEGGYFAAGAPFNLLNPGFVTLDPNTFLQAGLLSGVNGAFGGSPPFPSGAGVLAFVEFSILGNGTSPILVAGAVDSVPEPATLALLGLGVSLLPLRRTFQRTAGA
jgi:PEP-CTERM motif